MVTTSAGVRVAIRPSLRALHSRMYTFVNMLAWRMGVMIPL